MQSLVGLDKTVDFIYKFVRNFTGHRRNPGWKHMYVIVCHCMVFRQIV